VKNVWSIVVFAVMLTALVAEFIVWISSPLPKDFRQLVNSIDGIAAVAALLLTVVLVPLLSSKLNVDLLTQDYIETFRKQLAASLSLRDLGRVKRVFIVMSILLPISTLAGFAAYAYGLLLLSAASFIPLMFTFVMILKPLIDVEEHKSKIDKELPWFVLFLYISEGSDVGINYLLRRLHETGILEAIGREVGAILKGATLYERSIPDAMLARSVVTPHKRFSRILHNYAHRLRSGSSPYEWLQTALSEELMHLEYKQKMYSERVLSTLIQFALGGFVLAPFMMSLAGAPIITSLSIAVLLYPISIALMRFSKPVTYSELSMRVKFASFAATSALALGLLVLPRNYIALLVAACLAFIVPVEISIRRIEKVCEEAVELVRIVADYVRSGSGILRALENALPSLSNTTRAILRKVLTEIRNGIPLTKVARRYVKRYRFLAYSLFALGLVAESRAEKASILYIVYDSFKRIKSIADTSTKAMYLFDAISVASILLLSWGFSSVSTIASSTAGLFTLPFALSSADMRMIILAAAFMYSSLSTYGRRGLLGLDLRGATLFTISVLLGMCLARAL